MVLAYPQKSNDLEWFAAFNTAMISLTFIRQGAKNSMPGFWQQYEIHPFPALRGHHTSDVAIIGAGYTGRWLKDSVLKVMLVDREVAGYGASGRNGGPFRRLELDLGVFFPDDAMIHPLKLLDALDQVVDGRPIFPPISTARLITQKGFAS